MRLLTFCLILGGVFTGTVLSSHPTQHAFARSITPRDFRVYVRPTPSYGRAAMRPQVPQIQAGLQSLPRHLWSSLEHIWLMGQPSDTRARASSRQMILYLREFTSGPELQRVITHELAHVIDGGWLVGQGPLDTDFHDLGAGVRHGDPSLDFYRLCWVNDTQRKPECGRHAFVSGYAQHSPYEDFAETLTAYRWEGRAFRRRAVTDPLLRAKYHWLRQTVFNGQEYDTGTPTVLDHTVWDVTQLGT